MEFLAAETLGHFQKQEQKNQALIYIQFSLWYSEVPSIQQQLFQ